MDRVHPFDRAPSTGKRIAVVGAGPAGLSGAIELARLIRKDTEAGGDLGEIEIGVLDSDLVLAQVLFGIGGGAAMPALMAMAVSKGSRTDSMGSVMAILTVGHSSGMLLGSLLGGFLMDWFDLRWAFPIGAALMLGCLAVFYGAGARPGREVQARDPGAN